MFDESHDDGRRGEGELLSTNPVNLDQPILAIFINFAVIICNIATFWIVTSRAPGAARLSMYILNNLFSIIGIGIALVSVRVGFLSLNNTPNRITFVLFCTMTLLVCLGTFA